MTYAEDIARTLDIFFRATAAAVLEVRRLYSRGAESCWLTPDDIELVSRLIADTDDLRNYRELYHAQPPQARTLSRSHARFARYRKAGHSGR